MDSQELSQRELQPPTLGCGLPPFSHGMIEPVVYNLVCVVCVLGPPTMTRSAATLETMSCVPTQWHRDNQLQVFRHVIHVGVAANRAGNSQTSEAMAKKAVADVHFPAFVNTWDKGTILMRNSPSPENIKASML